MGSGNLHDGDLLAAPRKVDRLAITYAQSSKQVWHELCVRFTHPSNATFPLHGLMHLWLRWMCEH